MPSYATYQLEVRHEGLHKYRLIKGSDRFVVEQKAAVQKRAWDEIWEKKQAALSVLEARQKASNEKESKKAFASERTAEAQEALTKIEQTLVYTLNVDDRIEWDSLLESTPFPKRLPPEPKWHSFPREPEGSDPEFAPLRKWYHAFVGSLRKTAVQVAKNRFVAAHESWGRQVAQIDAKNKKLEAEYKLSVQHWQEAKDTYETEQAKRNSEILEKKKAYFGSNPQAIVEYCDMVLSNSRCPDTFPQEWNLEYLEDSRSMVVDYFLPSPDDVPKLKEVKYAPSKDELTEVQLQEAAFNKLYDSLLYQIALRSIHEVYESDQIDAVASIVFNGWVRSVDRGTGKLVTACVLSVQASRVEFQQIDLKHVDPKQCFKTLKGVGSSKLHGLSPIAPILQLNKDDKRFVSSYSVSGDIDQHTNLAAMDWEDFEHLIRELFEKEFSQNGGEVKITQASRDGGVDAVAFDPDPIRGGKMVIQAKRYTNVVGVAAVRDLYGTVVHEGATKGILVTTADFGPDAFAFANGKPLTLISGSGLLHLLEKHGHKATIDLKAAKQVLAEQKHAEDARRW
jgi:restriction system protein